MHAFLSNLAKRQTDRQTNTGKTYTFSFVGGNNLTAVQEKINYFCVRHLCVRGARSLVVIMTPGSDATLLLLLVCVSLTIIGQPRNSVFIRIV